MIKLLYVMLVIVFFFLFIVPTIFCYNPSILMNTKYDIVSNLKMNDINEPAIFAISHDDTVFDQIIMLTEIHKNKNKFNVVSGVSPDWYNEFCKSLPLFASYSLLKVRKGKSNKIVEKSLDILKNKKENLLMFIERGTNRTGLYHIVKNTDVPVILVSIIPLEPGRKNPFNRKFKINYKKLVNYECKDDPKKFMNHVKKSIYES